MTNAVLLKDIELVVRDISSGGCLLESRTPLQVGTVGWLDVEFEGQRRCEWFRIARVRQSGAQTWLCGVEFLPLAAAGGDSLRAAVGRMRRAMRAGGSARAAGRSSGDPRNSGRGAARRRRGASPEAAEAARKVIEFTAPARQTTDGNDVAQSPPYGRAGVRGPAKEN